jgi:outer membrane lipoprotein-sorting protein
MKRPMMSTSALLVLTVALGAWAQVGEQRSNEPKSEIDSVLERLNEKTRQLKSYQCLIEHKYVQPLPDSQTIRRGTMYYIRSGAKSALRVNFATVKVEDQKERKAIKQYIVVDGTWLDYSDRPLDGIWLAQIDHQLKEVKYCQLAEAEDPNSPIDVFDLVSKYLPMPGFAGSEELKEQFNVALVEQEKGVSEGLTQVSLEVKPTSVRTDDFVSVDIWIDKKVGLPAKVRAIRPDPIPENRDVDEFRFLKPKVNKGLSRKTFEFKIPRGFGRPEIIPLRETSRRRLDYSGDTERE